MARTLVVWQTELGPDTKVLNAAIDSVRPVIVDDLYVIWMVWRLVSGRYEVKRLYAEIEVPSFVKGAPFGVESTHPSRWISMNFSKSP